MDRRRLLQTGLSATTLIAGCLALPDGGGTPTRRPTVAIVKRDDPPAIPVVPSIEVVTPAASDDRPPELRATVENTADYPIEVGEERAIVFAFVSSAERPGLSLVPSGHEATPVEPGCWRLAEPIAIPEYYGIVPLGPGESTQRRLRVWGGADGLGCLQKGSFRFVTQYVGARDRTEDMDDTEWSARWGFTLDLR